MNFISQKFRFDIFIWLNAIWFGVGLFFFNWNPQSIILAYFIETLIIGFFLIIKVILVTFFNKEQAKILDTTIRKSFTEKELKVLSKTGSTKFIQIITILFITAFSSTIFLGFLWGQSIFTFLMLSKFNTNISDSPTALWNNLQFFFSQKDFTQACLSIFLFNSIKFFRYFIYPKIYLSKSFEEISYEPWVRIFIQQIFVIGGGCLFFIFGNEIKLIVLFLVLLKTIFESIDIEKIYTNRKNKYEQ